MFIGRLQQIIISVNQLYVFSLGHIYASVSRSTNSLIGLAHIDDIVTDVKQCADSRRVASVINHNNLPTVIAERQIAYAVYA